MSMPAGAVNYYQCQLCAKYIRTEHLVEGVTPMMLACRVTEGCQGRMMSTMYSYPPPSMMALLADAPQFEWYMPTEKELKKHTREVKDHCRAGGLLLREKK